MVPRLDLWEPRVGVYADDDAIDRLLDRARGLLKGQVASSLVERFDAAASAESDIEHDDEVEPMSLAELYSALPEQWRIEHPGRDPGRRSVFELRAGVLTDEDHAEQVLDDLTRLMCPDPAHSGPCPIPWSASRTGAVDDTYRDYLERHYGQLRAGTTPG